MSLRRLIFVLPVAIAISPALSPAQEPAYLNTKLSPQERAHDLVEPHDAR